MQKNTVKSITATMQNEVAKADGGFWVTQSEVNFTPFNKKARSRSKKLVHAF